VNYHETIVIPTLQKKLQELQNTNLVLEVALLVEQAKVKDANDQIRDYDSIKKCNDELLNYKKLYTDLEQKYNREVSLKDNILSEYNILKTKHDSIMTENESLKVSINKKK